MPKLASSAGISPNGCLRFRVPISVIISGHSTYSDEGKISYESLTPYWLSMQILSMKCSNLSLKPDEKTLQLFAFLLCIPVLAVMGSL